jgi:DNA-binding beta-propeller fold protein YncE
MRFQLGSVLALLFAACAVPGGGDDGGGGGGGDDDVGIGDDDGGGDDGGSLPDECDPGELTAGVSTIAGCGDAGAADGARGIARFSNPVNVEVGPGGRVYVADFDNDLVRVVDPDGAVTTLVGAENFQRPFGLAYANGSLFVSTDNNDAGDHSTMTGTIWKVDVDSGAAAVVVRNIGRPRGLLALADGRIVMSDYQHHSLRVLDPTDATIVNLAGAFDQEGMVDARGATARFSAPYGMAQLADGRILVADLYNNRIRAVELDGDVTTYAGDGAAGDVDGAAASASFSGPQDVAIDESGDVYVADLDNYVIRKISGGMVTTLAGDGVGGWADSVDLRAAEFFGLEGLAVGDGALWVADGSRGEDLPYNRVRRVQLP